jgi:hypothetical protein
VEASPHHQHFPSCSGADAFCHTQLQSGIRASHQNGQHARSADIGDDSTLSRACHWSSDFPAHRALSTVSCTFFRPHLPQVLGDRQLFSIIEQQRELSLLCDSFSRSPPDPAETQTLLWNPLDRLATSGSTIPEKA